MHKTFEKKVCELVNWYELTKKDYKSYTTYYISDNEKNETQYQISKSTYKFLKQHFYTWQSIVFYKGMTYILSIMAFLLVLIHIWS